MVYLSTSEEWQRQSSLLLQARPTTTVVSTKYKIPNLDSPKYQNVKKRKRSTEAEEKDEDAAAPRVPRGVLVLKTYDSASGVCLKLKTDRAAEVGRLINGLGRLGRHMAALPDEPEAPEAIVEDQPSEGAAASKDATTADAKPQQTPAGGGGGGKKKKKGKK